MLSIRSIKSLRSLPLRRNLSFPLATFSSSPEYDVVVIGGGPGGYVAAIKSAQLGLKTACIESRGSLGGTCLNVGCIPSKALLHATHMYHQATHDFKKLGIETNGPVTMNFNQMMKSKDKAVRGLTNGVEGLFKKYKVTYIKGHGKIKSTNEITVTNETENSSVTTKNILIATGSEVAPLPPVPVDNEQGKIVDSTGAIALKEVPKHLVVIGAGVIGLELGSVYKRLGAKVTVVEYMDRVCPGMDSEIAREFTKILKKQGFEFQFATKVTGSEVQSNGQVKLTMEPSKGGDSSTIECDTVLVATGRRPFTKNLGLEEMGIQTDKIGRIEVNEKFQTQLPNIYAIGDVIKGPMLAHKAEEEGVACVENIAGLHGHINYGAIPGVIYTYPEVATVGQSEDELKEAGVNYKVGKFPMMANSRARAMDDAEGVVKVITNAEDDKILGVHIIASNAGEMIAEGVLGLEYGAASEDLARTCHAHPTLSEAMKEACLAAHGKTINF